MMTLLLLLPHISKNSWRRIVNTESNDCDLPFTIYSAKWAYGYLSSRFMGKYYCFLLLDVCLYFEGVGYTCTSFEKEDIHVEGSGVFFVVVFFYSFLAGLK